MATGDQPFSWRSTPTKRAKAIADIGNDEVQRIHRGDRGHPGEFIRGGSRLDRAGLARVTDLPGEATIPGNSEGPGDRSPRPSIAAG
jgi:hypothetical protein